MSEYNVSFSNTPLHPGSNGTGFIPNAALGVTFSGNFADGQTMTVNLPGGGLGARINPKPLYWFWLGEDGSTNFSSDTSICRTAKTLTPNPNCIIQSGVTPPNSLGACQYLPVGSGSSTSNIPFPDSPWFNSDTNADTGLNQTYIWWKRNYAFAAQPFNVKFPRFWSPSGPGGTGFPTAFIGVQPTDYSIKVDDGNGNVTNLNVPSLFISYPNTLSTWWTDEHWWQESTINTTDGVWNGARQSGFALPLNALWQMGTTTSAGPMFRIFGDEYSTGGTSPNGTTDLAYLGPMFVDDSWLQLVVTDEGGTLLTSTWRSGGAVQQNREIQLQTSRSNTSVTFRVRQGSHASMTGKNLLAYTGQGTAINLGVGA